MKANFFIVRVALIVALGGFLMGFDASVISGVNKFVELEFNLTKLQLGWAVASLTLTATLAMMVSGPISDAIGRRSILTYAAALYTLSAIGSALAPDFTTLVLARMLGGIGVGISLIIAPMYIAEISPASVRGRMVSFNQLNIVLGISVAFFTNYLILKLGSSTSSWAQALRFDEYNWRWMLGLEALPAAFYFVALFLVPGSPRWLAMKGRYDEALRIMTRCTSPQMAEQTMAEIRQAMSPDRPQRKVKLKQLLHPSLRLVLLIGIVVGVLQQITGINSVFFYAPMIFEQSGIGTDAAFSQAIMVGLVNLTFTLLAIAFIDKVGRRPLLIVGVAGITCCMAMLSFGFYQARYELTPERVEQLPVAIDRAALSPMLGQIFTSDLSYKQALEAHLSPEQSKQYEAPLITAAASMNTTLILIAILGFVASFAVSLGPVMWVLFSELFPTWIRGLAISFVGLINSAVSFGVQLAFPWELENLGSTYTFLIYAVFAAAGLVFILWKVPETKGKTLEQLEASLVNSTAHVN